MVMVWLEGGQGEVRGASPPPHTPNRPTWIPPPHPNSSHLDPPPTVPEPPHSPLLDPPLPCPPLPPPPQGASGQRLVGGVVGGGRGVTPCFFGSSHSSGVYARARLRLPACTKGGANLSFVRTHATCETQH